MCKICGYYRCPSGCPNAPEPEIVFNCAECGKPIRVGNEYIEFDSSNYCVDCIEAMSIPELVQFFGGSYNTASESDIEDNSDYAYEQWKEMRLFDD